MVLTRSGAGAEGISVNPKRSSFATFVSSIRGGRSRSQEVHPVSQSTPLKKSEIHLNLTEREGTSQDSRLFSSYSVQKPRNKTEKMEGDYIR